ncbi:MAG: DUF92 domain-containing protein [Bacteroidota bacterium]
MRLFSAPTSDEWLFLAIVFFLVVLLIAAAELIRRLFNGDSEFTRKFVHIISGILMMCAPYVFYSGIPAVTIAGIMVIGTFLSIRFDFLKSIHGTDRTSYGTMYHPLSFLVLVLLFWDISPMILSISVLILAIPDALAAIIGQNVRTRHFLSIGANKKTVEGSITMFLSTVASILLGFYFFNVTAETSIIIIAVVTSLFATGWELISFKGLDNFTVPLSTAFILHYFLTISPHHVPEQLITAIALGAGIGILSYYFKFLSLSGSIATFLLATIIYGIGGWKWTVPILTFFIASSLLSKYGKSRKKKLEHIFDKTDKRDSGQVAANGGIAGIIILLWYIFPEHIELYFVYLASIAAVTADTWGTEIGTLMKGKPRSIITFQKVETGTSGGVSIIGFAGGIIGTTIVVCSACWMNSASFSVELAIALVTVGCIGSIIDSILGATIQAQYVTESGKLTEKSVVDEKPTRLVRGFRWFTNDMVNWFCAASGAATMYFLL